MTYHNRTTTGRRSRLWPLAAALAAALPSGCQFWDGSEPNLSFDSVMHSAGITDVPPQSEPDLDDLPEHEEQVAERE